MNIPPPQRVPLVDANGLITREWIKWFDIKFGESAPTTAVDDDGTTFEVASAQQAERVEVVEKEVARLLQAPMAPEAVPAFVDDAPSVQQQIEELRAAIAQLQQAITP